MAIYAGANECRVIYVARNGQQLRVSSVWVGDRQVFPPANRQETHAFTRDTQKYSRYDYGTFFGFVVPVPWWATSMDVAVLGAGEKGRDGTKSFSGGSDGAGGRSGAWVVKTVALNQVAEAVVYVGKGTSTSPHATEVILPGVDGMPDVRVHDGEGTRTPNSGSTGGSVTPYQRADYGATHTGGAGGTRNNPGKHPGGGGGGGQGSNLLGNPRAGQPGGDGYVWLRFRSAPSLDPGDERFVLRVGVNSGDAYTPLREWSVGIGKTHQTITEITAPVEVVGPSLRRLFYGCQSLVTVPDLDTSNVTNMYAMFNGCSSLASVPDMDTSQVTDMSGMFEKCSSLVSVPEMSTSNVTSMFAMFFHCSSLTTIPELDTSNVTSTRSMFEGCSSLTTIPELDTSNVTNMRFMFNGCSSLVSVPDMDTSQVTDMYAMFQGCSSLTSLPALDADQATDIYGMFYGCSSLESVALPGMGNGFTTKQTLDMLDTKMNAAAANALMQSLGTVPAIATKSNLVLPATAKGANTSIAAGKNWTVTFG